MRERDEFEPGESEKATSLELQERIKELQLLHHAARLIEMQGEPRDLLRAVLELLPNAMCYPELAGARLSAGDLEVATRGYEQTALCLSTHLDMGDGTAGCIEVCYAAEPQRPPSQPVFLDEERSLLASLAQLLRGYFARRRADATQERLLEARAAEQSALSDNRAKDRFLSTVAHELRSSLHVMHGWLQILRSNPASGELTARGLEILQRNVTLQAKLIEDLMDLSRISVDKVQLDRRRLDLAELVSFAVDATKPAAMAKQLALTSAIEAVGHVLADQQRLQQIVYNLLGNAVKFTPAGGRIHVALERVGASARLRVVDSGIGIDSELLPHVFERFRQAPSATHGRSGGLGLGLPIARHLVELHGGTISVRSNQPEAGTTFEVSLPLHE